MKKTCTKCGKVYNGREEHIICGICKHSIPVKKVEVVKAVFVAPVVIVDPKEDFSDIDFHNASPDDYVPIIKESTPVFTSSKKKKKNRK
jgi:hypothetical protein